MGVMIDDVQRLKITVEYPDGTVTALTLAPPFEESLDLEIEDDPPHHDGFRRVRHTGVVTFRATGKKVEYEFHPPLPGRGIFERAKRWWSEA